MLQQAIYKFILLRWNTLPYKKALNKQTQSSWKKCLKSYSAEKNLWPFEFLNSPAKLPETFLSILCVPSMKVLALSSARRKDYINFFHSSLPLAFLKEVNSWFSALSRASIFFRGCGNRRIAVFFIHKPEIDTFYMGERHEREAIFF